MIILKKTFERRYMVLVSIAVVLEAVRSRFVIGSASLGFLGRFASLKMTNTSRTFCERFARDSAR